MDWKEFDRDHTGFDTGDREKIYTYHSEGFLKVTLTQRIYRRRHRAIILLQSMRREHSQICLAIPFKKGRKIEKCEVFGEFAAVPETWFDPPIMGHLRYSNAMCLINDPKWSKDTNAPGLAKLWLSDENEKQMSVDQNLTENEDIVSHICEGFKAAVCHSHPILGMDSFGNAKEDCLPKGYSFASDNDYYYNAAVAENLKGRAEYLENDWE